MRCNMNSEVGQQPTQQVAYVIAVIAKCPIAGQSKTRLQPLFSKSNELHHLPQQQQPHDHNDHDGASILAKALLCDVLVSISHCCRQARKNNRKRNNNNNKAEIMIDQLLFYAPPNQTGCDMMQHIVNTCHDKDGSTIISSTGSIKDDWTLLPIDNSHPNSTTTTTTNNDYESQSNNLSNILSNVVRTGQNRHATIPTTVILFGMDAPEIPMPELYTIITTPSSSSSSFPTTTTSAFLCPAYDGGYVMLSIPPMVRQEMIDTIFQSVAPYWSHPLTAMAQIKALSDVGIATIIGPIVHDIDTPDDVLELIQRLRSNNMQLSYDTTVAAVVDVEVETKMEIEGCCLHRPSALRGTTATFTNKSETSIFHDFIPCQHIRQALIDLQLF
jgi:glycosyltransferase A (GT-A) superfamily protein (DUF2064 family)